MFTVVIVLFHVYRILRGMASCPQSVPVIREVPPPDLDSGPDQEAEEDVNDGDDNQQMCTLDVPSRSRHDSYR